MSDKVISLNACDNLTMEEAVERSKLVAKAEKKPMWSRRNVDSYCKNRALHLFREIYEGADLDPDAMEALIWMPRLLALLLRKNISGSDYIS